VLLYDYYRSSAAYRVRIALNLKGVGYTSREVHLLRDGGEHLKPEYRAINPQVRVPSLALDDGTVIIQSPAILEWLEETHPEPPLLPRDAVARARVRGVAAIVVCDIHPIDNLCVLNYLRGPLHLEQPAVDAWYHHWILEGFRAIEALIEGTPFCFGEQPTLADVVLVPQVANARRQAVLLHEFPKIVGVDAACAKIGAFARAQPEAVRPAGS
jgi:maleylacetoacetate isomerase